MIHPRRAAPSADFGDDDKVIPIRMERFADDLVGDVRSVEVGGVDVIHPACNGFTQYG